MNCLLCFGFILMFYIHGSDAVTITAPSGGACTIDAVDEGAIGAAVTGTIIDAEPSGGTVTFALQAGGDSDLFMIADDGEGVVTLKGASTVDYETLTNKWLTVVIVASDSGDSTTDTASCTVAVNDVQNTFTANLVPLSLYVKKSISTGTTVGTYTCDGVAAASTYTISTNDYFEMVGADLKTKADLSGLADNMKVQVTVTCDDGETALSPVVTICIGGYTCASGSTMISGIVQSLASVLLCFIYRLF